MLSGVPPNIGETQELSESLGRVHCLGFSVSVCLCCAAPGYLIGGMGDELPLKIVWIHGASAFSKRLAHPLAPAPRQESERAATVIATVRNWTRNDAELGELYRP